MLRNTFPLACKILLLNSFLLSSRNLISCEEVDERISSGNIDSMVCNRGRKRIRSCSCSLLGFVMTARKSARGKKQLEKALIGKENLLVDDDSVVSTLALNFPNFLALNFVDQF